jgi:hypothetical protein
MLFACGTAADDIDHQTDDLTDTVEPSWDIGDNEVWVVMQSHLHTTGQHDCATNPTDPGPLPDGECYSSAGIEGFLDAALDYGASDMIITDHNNVDAWFDPAFVPKASHDGKRYATPLRGTEWSSGEGHMTLFFPRQVVDSNEEAIDLGLIWAAGNHSDDPTNAEYEQTIARVQELGGLVVINHPDLMIHPFDERTYGADAVEVGVRLTPFQSTWETRMWWHRRLVEDNRLTAMAGSDHHHGGADLPLMHDPIFGVAVNLLRIDSGLPNYDDVADALADPSGTIDMRSDIAADAIRRGHVMVVEETNTPRIYLGGDLDDDGRYHDVRAGDCVPSSYDGEFLNLRVRVTQPDQEDISGHYNVKFYDERRDNKAWFYVELDPQEGFETSKHYDIDPDDPFAVELRVPLELRGAGFVRVEIERDVFGPFNDEKTISNPIYFGPWGSECDGSEPLR